VDLAHCWRTLAKSNDYSGHMPSSVPSQVDMARKGHSFVAVAFSCSVVFYP